MVKCKILRAFFFISAIIILISALLIINVGPVLAINADSDSDGLTDSDEIDIYGTDPLNYDTDWDGLGDGEEVNVYGTDPLDQDTDYDFLTDGQEVNIYGTDPLNFDTDNDFLTDGQEVNIYGTDPLNPDTDGDGLWDCDEDYYGTDPLNPDTDWDGLSDGDEVFNYGTDPLAEDTDSDGYSDGEEIAEGSDPNDPFSVPNQPPVADAGSDQIVEANTYNAADNVVLNGSGSYDPDFDVLTYDWTWTGGLANGVNPTVTIPLGTINITLTVSDGELTDTDTVDVTVVDTTPPTLVAPPDIIVVANTAGGYSGDIGMATASDVCDPDVGITNNAPTVFPLGDTTVTWNATDDSGNSSSVTQIVTVEAIQITIDIKPGSYPNSINLKSKGVVPVAIITTDDLDAANALPESIVFAGAQPLRWAMEDVNDDGDMDMILHFSVQQLNLSSSSEEAVMTGTTLDFNPFEGTDSVRVVK